MHTAVQLFHDRFYHHHIKLSCLHGAAHGETHRVTHLLYTKQNTWAEGLQQYGVKTVYQCVPS